VKIFIFLNNQLPSWQNISVQYALILLHDKNSLLKARTLFPNINDKAFKRLTD